MPVENVRSNVSKTAVKTLKYIHSVNIFPRLTNFKKTKNNTNRILINQSIAFITFATTI